MHINSIIIFVMLFFLNSCSSVMPDWVGGKDNKAKMEGKRISVLAHTTKIKRDSDHKSIKIILPKKNKNNSWPLQRISSVEHPEFLGTKPNEIERVSIGDDPDDAIRLTSAPVVAKGKVITLDASGKIQARDEKNISNILWEIELSTPSMASDSLLTLGLTSGQTNTEFLGGNIVYDNNTVFVTTAFGMIYAVDVNNGKVKWNKSVEIPIKSTSVVNNGKIYFTTSRNKLYAIDQKDGNTLWTYSGISEITSIYGASGPSISDDGKTLIVPYSSGELLAINSENGKPIWSEVLTGGSGSNSSIYSLNDIDATPIISKDKVYAVSSDGVLTSLDINTGKRLWTKDISSVQTPWISGDFLYILTSNNELLCINAPDGRIKWIGQFPKHSSPLVSWSEDDKGDTISWSGPILAGGKIFVTGSHGRMAIVSPYSGKIIDAVEILPNTYLPPIVVNNKMYILSNESELSALK